MGPAAPLPPNEHPAHWREAHLHDESVTALAGEGAPWVAEFAPAHLGAALGITLDASPLCRTHHRVKTHSRWHYKHLDNASYEWTAPTGHQYTVAPTPRQPRRA